jgi:CubicO group peptidase (beta-lactamase class C family)
VKFQFSKKTSIRVMLSAIAALLLVLILFLLPLFNRKPTTEDPIPLSGIDKEWADSVFLQLDAYGKASQLMVQSLPAGWLKSTPANLPATRGGYLIPVDSSGNCREIAAQLHQTSIPPLVMIDSVDQIRDFPLHFTKAALLSVHSDSLIDQYLEHHLTAAQAAGSGMVHYPLWEDRKHTIHQPDTVYLKREVELIRLFLRKSIEYKLIPVVSLPRIALRLSSPRNQLDSTVNRLCGSIIHPDLPAIVLDSVPPALQQNGGLKNHLLRQFGFRGLILIRKHCTKGADLSEALTAGADMVINQSTSFDLDREDVQLLLNTPSQLALVNRAAQKVLYYKSWQKPRTRWSQADAYPAITPLAHIRLMLRLEAGAAILLRDSAGLIPLKDAGKTRYLLHLPEGVDYEVFTHTFGLFSDFRIKRYKHLWQLKPDRNSFNIVVMQGMNAREMQTLAGARRPRDRSIYVHVGDLADLPFLHDFPTLIHIARNHPGSERFLANALFGGNAAKGMVPWDLSKRAPAGSGITDKPIVRLNHSIPEEAGIQEAYLIRIDSIILEAISNSAFPGCQVFIAKQGHVIYHKSFGETFYESGEPVTPDHLFDVASLTKVAATTLACMKMVDDRRIRLSDPLGRYFINKSPSLNDAIPDTLVTYDTLVVKGSSARRESVLAKYQGYEKINETLYLVSDTLLFTSSHKKNVFLIPVRKFLTHTSGLPPSLPINSFIAAPGRILGLNRFRSYYSLVYLPDSATVKVAEGMYLYDHYIDTLWARSRAVGLNSKAKYVYSDANMIFIQQAIDTINKRPISQYLEEQFYHPLGLRHCLFNPLEHFPKTQIVPTANDMRWRKQQIQGTVHDPTAALLGGVAGNAGLFSNAGDLGIIGQMLLQGGSYGGRNYIDSATISLFTTRETDGQRGMGFDLKSGGKSIAAPSASMRTYGHTGFTGTCIWVDPEHEIVYVFLSNRIFPNTENQKINYLKVREKVHQVIYDAMMQD